MLFYRLPATIPFTCLLRTATFFSPFCSQLNFLPLFPRSNPSSFEFFSFFSLFFFLHKWKDGNRSTMRKENMYNINERGRKKNQQIPLGDFAGVLRVWYAEENGESVLILPHFSFLIPPAPI